MPELLSPTETVSQSEISQHLTDATGRVVDQMGDSEFHESLLRAGITDIESADPALYWETMANFTSRKISSENLSGIERESLTLMSYLPNFLCKQQYLMAVESSGQTADRGAIRDAKRTASVYNSLIRDFVASHPQRADELKTSMLENVLSTVGAESDQFLRFAEAKIDATLKGVKHELGFSTILSELDIPHRGATTTEDLKGQDLVVQFMNHEIGIDVKASLDKVAAANSGYDGKPYGISRDGTIVMFSMLQESDFEGTFSPNEAIVRDRAEVMKDHVVDAIRDSLAKKHI